MLTSKPSHVVNAIELIKRKKELLKEIEEFGKVGPSYLAMRSNTHIALTIQRVKKETEAEIKELYELRIEDEVEDASESE